MVTVTIYYINNKKIKIKSSRSDSDNVDQWTPEPREDPALNQLQPTFFFFGCPFFVFLDADMLN